MAHSRCGAEDASEGGAQLVHTLGGGCSHAGPLVIAADEDQPAATTTTTYGCHSEHCRVGLVMGWCALVPHVSHHRGLPDLAVAVDQQANLAVVAALRAVAQRLERDGMTKPAVLTPKDVSNLSRICPSSDPESGLELNSAKGFTWQQSVLRT